MRLSQIRSELVAEHHALKQAATDIEAEVQRVLAGQHTLDGMRASLTRFADQLAAHNRHEETLLRDELRTIDAWGPQREALMDEDHEAEHADVVRSVTESLWLHDHQEIARRVQAMVRRVLEHLRREEKEILHPDLLRDDVVSISGASE